MRRLVIIISLLVIIPIAEIAVLIGVGQVIGLGWTLLLMLSTSALGGWLLRREGGRAWRTFQADLAENRPPGPSALDGMLVLLGGVFMLVPGFVSDAIGLFLIAPPTRPLSRAVLMRAVANRMSPATASSLFGPRRVRARAGSTSAGTHRDWAQRDGDRTAGRDAGEALEGEIVDP